MKKNLDIIITVAIVVIALFIILTMKFIGSNNNGVILLHQVYDTSIKENAIGLSNYVFVAKVNKKVRTIYEDKTPYTVYDVNVIKNIKGELITDKSIEIMQMGGRNKNKFNYILVDGTSLLEEDEYYVLMGYTELKDGGLVKFSDPNEIISLGTTYKSGKAKEIISEVETAFENERKFTELKDYISKYDVNYKK